MNTQQNQHERQLVVNALVSHAARWAANFLVELLGNHSRHLNAETAALLQTAV